MSPEALTSKETFMARANITDTTNDLIEDSGGVLWSLVQGEQLEFPINLNFLNKADPSYTFEAVLIEGNNDGEGNVPTEAQPTNPVKTVLEIKLPLDRGLWNTLTADYVMYDYVIDALGNYYLLYGVAAQGVEPRLDTDNWEAFTPNRIFLRFDETIGDTWAVQPGVDKPVYAFFELKVQEPVSASFRRTWKPVRGTLEIKYSPTHLVP